MPRQEEVEVAWKARLDLVVVEEGQEEQQLDLAGVEEGDQAQKEQLMRGEVLAEEAEAGEEERSFGLVVVEGVRIVVHHWELSVAAEAVLLG